MGDSTDNRYDVNNIIRYWKIEQLYGSLTMGVVILGIAVNFIINKKCKRFEWTVLSCMFIKYAIYASETKTDTYYELEERAKKG